jgi:hypothetical protein
VQLVEERAHPPREPAAGAVAVDWKQPDLLFFHSIAVIHAANSVDEVILGAADK